MTDRSLQERFIRELSTHLIGGQSVFKPSLYRNGEEPADLIWLSHRCAVIVNATSGKRNLQSKRDHNNSQMHRWLRRWKQGEVLRGPGLSLGFDDLDYIMGISIVGGENSASIIEDGQIIYARNKGNIKLCACATISDKVFHRICKRSVGIRDVIQFLEYLRARNDIVSDEDALEWIEYWEQHHAEQARNSFSDIIPDGDILNDAWKCTEIMLAGIKNHSEPEPDSRMLSDLSFADAVWLSVAERSLALKIAKSGDFGPVVMGSKRAIGNRSLNVIVAAHTGILASTDITMMISDGITMISSLDFGLESPLRMFAFDEEGGFIGSLLQRFSDELIGV